METYLPYHTPGLQPPLEEFQHEDPGHRADRSYTNLLSNGVKAIEITPNIGTEIVGIQLSELNSAQKDDLALLAAECGVVLFQDQYFADIRPERQREFGKHFGPLHIHQMGGHIKDFPKILPVYRDFL
jgi:sulfonate dioxygenase